MRVLLGCSQHRERQDTAQACEASQQPLDVSVGLMLIPVTSSKNEQKKARRGKIIWGWGGGGLWRGDSTRCPREDRLEPSALLEGETLGSCFPSPSHPSKSSWEGESHPWNNLMTPARSPWRCHGALR